MRTHPMLLMAFLLAALPALASIERDFVRMDRRY